MLSSEIRFVDSVPQEAEPLPGAVQTALTIQTTLLDVGSQMIALAERVAAQPERIAFKPSGIDFSHQSILKSIIESRRRRERIFGAELFADPAWDILLDLYYRHVLQTRVSISDACIGASVPQTTALRWIAILERDRLVVRRKDPLDARRFFLELSDQGLNKMRLYIDQRAKEHF